MKNIYDENLVNKEGNHANDESQKLPNISNHESPKLTPEKNRSEKDSQDKKDKSYRYIIIVKQFLMCIFL